MQADRARRRGAEGGKEFETHMSATRDRDARASERDKSRERTRTKTSVPAKRSDADTIYGRNAVMEAMEAGVGIEKLLIMKNIEGSGKKIFAMAKKRGIPIQGVDKFVLDKVCGTGGHQGVIAYATRFAYSSTEEILGIAAKRGENPFVLILDGIEDPRNLGAIIRSAEGAGVHGVVIPKRRAAAVTDVAIKTSAGAALHMSVARVSNIVKETESLKKQGLWIYGLDTEGSNFAESAYEGGVALVIGSEGRGLSTLVKAACDFLISIPMRGKTASLNASSAAAVAVFEINRHIFERDDRREER
ncbi:MAG: 23S rRNA (guanosine(2251)-2'-O)-methyltransferase RlmB [Clostridiales Family XIII bacterium]|jgi:23S rRNA (guanosine2251-2'-O)-methyltransferase|nr:23S rRNA (guanosine(2251)-2'-O)-methyltransferase RlmB [Clostridiales Family XIII bacterium]